ncbi:hypothetical protein CEN49_23655 [Fischerella thermalis CCMEE 5273]|nr:hypothetical protein CEN49_23655 [Fischerella thermalis CCMEE 5273]
MFYKAKIIADSGVCDRKQWGDDADAIESTTRPFSGSTGIANAIDFAVNLLNTNDYDGTRRVIDISGDGIENVSSDDGLKTARDNAVQAGIIINGLPILTGDPDLDDYYQRMISQTLVTLSPKKLDVKLSLTNQSLNR